MAEDGEQTPRQAQPQGPRPPAALQELRLQAGFAVRRTPPAAVPGEPSNDGSLRQVEGQPQRPDIRPARAADPVPSNDGSLRQGTSQPQGQASGNRPTVRPPGHRPVVRRPAGTPHPATASGMNGAAAVQPSGEGRPYSDDSQTDNYCPPGQPARELGGREAIESLDGRRPRPGSQHFPEMEDDPMESHRSTIPAADVLLEAPEPEEAIPAPGAPVARQADPGKPSGPDYGELRTVIVASMAMTEKSRQKWRRLDLTKSGELDEAKSEDIVAKPGRLKVATPETLQEYLAVGRRLMNRFKRESDVQFSLEDVDPREFVNWLLGLRPFLTSNTWRKYRASATAIIQTIPSNYLDEAVAMLNADLHVGNDEGPPVSKKKGQDGSSAKAKRVDHQHLQQLKRRLRVTTRSQAQVWLRDWLDAGINTGLRPMEWALTTLERRPDRRFPNGRVWLHVVSAKAADGRATHRTLDLSNFSTEALESVVRMVERSRDWVLTGSWANRQWEVARLLRTTCQNLFPRLQRQYTLYSLRHQFIANMKTIYTREEVAAMVGHISLETQVEHYGKKRVAWDSNLIVEVPMPVEEQVAHIRKRLELFDERRADIAAKEAAKRGGDPDDLEDEDDELDEDAGYDPGDDQETSRRVDTSPLEPERTIKASDVDPTVS